MEWGTGIDSSFVEKKKDKKKDMIDLEKKKARHWLVHHKGHPGNRLVESSHCFAD